MKRGTLGYYRRMAQALRAAGSSPLVEELDRVVSEIERAAGCSEPARSSTRLLSGSTR